MTKVCFATLAQTIALGLALIACSSAPTTPSATTTTVTSTPTPTAGSPAVRVLMLTATAGFRHDSIGAARQALATLATATGVFTVTATEDLNAISSANLPNFDVVFFALTSGELALRDEQKAALLTFVNGGGGFMGAHSASDTLYEWPEYGGLVGAYFKEHPWTQLATVVVENASHPISAGTSAGFSINEEFYTFRENPRARVTVLLRLDANSVGSTGDFPLAWAQTYGNGRVYYNALGHFSSTWIDAQFQRQLLNAIQWTARRTG